MNNTIHGTGDIEGYVPILMEFSALMGSDTSHSAIEAIGGLNLPGREDFAPF